MSIWCWLIDTSPVLAVSDPLSVATHTDGVILVAASHASRIEGLRHAAEAVHQGDPPRRRDPEPTRGQAGGSYYCEYYGPQQEPAKRNPFRRDMAGPSPTGD